MLQDGTRDARWHAAAFGTGVAGPAYTCLMQHWTIPAMVDDGFAAYVAAHIMSGEIATDAPTFRGFKLVTPPNRCTVGFVKMEEYLSGKQAKSAKDLSAGDFHGLCKLWHTYYIHELHKVTGGSSLDDPAPTSKPWCPGNLQVRNHLWVGVHRVQQLCVLCVTLLYHPRLAPAAALVAISLLPRPVCCRGVH